MAAPLTRRSFLHTSSGLSGAAIATSAFGACSSTSPQSSAGATATTAVTDGEEAVRRLMEGNARFARDATHNPRRDTIRRAEQAEGQTPFAIIVG